MSNKLNSSTMMESIKKNKNISIISQVEVP